MKYMRKTPVEAIQWKGDNLYDVHDFIVKTAQYCCSKADSGSLVVAWEDLRGRKFKTVVPLFGWVVREGKTLQFYKDTTFHKTFDEVPDGEHKKIIDIILKDAEGQINAKLEGKEAPFMDNLYKVIFDNPSQSVFAKYDNLINPDGRLTKLIDDLYKDDEKTREEIKKNLSEGLKEMAGSDTHKATFESVLDEMKELHAKKDKDYNESFHNLFKEYGMPYALAHIEEKLNRVKAIIANGGNAVKNEHIEDSLIDGACYNILTLIELRNGKH